MNLPESNSGDVDHEMTSQVSRIVVGSDQASTMSACGESALADACQDTEFCCQLSRHLHDLKNLLWPATVQAECAHAEAAPAELSQLLQCIGRDMQRALAIATQMSELVQRHSESCAPPAQVQATAAAARQPPDALSRKRILCVADDASVRSTLARMLQYLGYDVDLSGSGSEALQAFASQTYSLVLTETHLADMTGRDITKCIRGCGCTPVIWMTGREQISGESIAEGPESPSCILTKPLTLSGLRTALADVAAAAAAFSKATSSDRPDPVPAR
jgi:CheY-like chemotaxis protein